MDKNELRNKIIGLGENSFKKSYYPELNQKIDELKLFHQIFEKTNDIVIVIESATGIIKYLNNSVSNHFSGKEKYIDRPVYELLGSEFTERLQKYKQSETDNKFIVEITHNSMLLALESVLNKIITDETEFIIAIIRDITAHLKAKEELRIKNKELTRSNDIIKTINNELLIAKERAEESDKLKSAFLANMSHEIRTPMNGIIGFAHLLNNDKLTAEKRQKYLNIIQSSSTQLLTIISDIVDISKIEAGQLKISPEEFNINALLDELFTQFKMELGKNRPDVKLLLTKDLSSDKCSITTDKVRLKQVITNLLGNASKFTHKGTIEFGYSVGEPSKIVFYVKDTGIGISQENQHVIFDRFSQSVSKGGEDYGGTGLGLSISKGIVQLMDGQIFVNSEEGKGAHFWFEIPYVQNNKITNEVATQKDFPLNYNWKGKTILIAEDEESNYFYINEILKTTGISILHSRTGNETISMFEQHPEINMVLMDIKMPNTNGFEATKIIKEKNPNIPVIAQTAYALAGDRERAISYGCNDYISKPIERKLLLEIINRHLNKLI